MATHPSHAARYLQTLKCIYFCAHNTRIDPEFMFSVVMVICIVTIVITSSKGRHSEAIWAPLHNLVLTHS